MNFQLFRIWTWRFVGMVSLIIFLVCVVIITSGAYTFSYPTVVLLVSAVLAITQLEAASRAQNNNWADAEFFFVVGIILTFLIVSGGVLYR